MDEMTIDEFEAKVLEGFRAWKASYLEGQEKAVGTDEEWPDKNDFAMWWEFFAESKEMCEL